MGRIDLPDPIRDEDIRIDKPIIPPPIVHNDPGDENDFKEEPLENAFRPVSLSIRKEKSRNG